MTHAAPAIPWQVAPIDPALVGQRPLPAAAPTIDFDRPGAGSASPFLDREKLAALLAEYNSSVGNPLSDTTLAAVRGAGLFVIAGQQPGLLLGPLYTLLKAVTAISLAEKMRGSFAVPLIPAFWIASEDHDLAEVNHTTLLGNRIAVAGHPLGTPPVGGVSLESHREQILAEFAAAMEGQPHGGWAVQLVRSARFDNYAVLCAELLARLLPGRLVLIDPLRLRPLTAPVLLHLMSRWAELEKAFKRGVSTLRQQGLAAPLERMNIYRIENGHRTPIGPDDTRDPQQISPGAALRPIVQDAVLPTLATIGGPTELQYLWQIDPLYAVAGVRRSLLAQRLRATFVDTQTRRRAERFGLGGDKIFGVLEALRGYDTLAASAGSPPDAAAKIGAASAELLRLIDSVAGEPAAKTFRKAHNSIAYQTGRVTKRLMEHRLELAGAGRRNLAKVAEVVYPAGDLQERVASPFDMLGRSGPAFLDGLLGLDPTRDCHWLVSTGPKQGEDA